MTQTSTDAAETDVRDGAAAPSRGVGLLGALTATGVLVGLAVVLLVLSAWHITQGTSGIGLRDLLGALTGAASPAEAGPSVRDILIGSRPRVGAAVLVGIALGVAGALFQSLARNPLASPDTLAVTGGAYFAVTLVTAFGLAVPVWASGGVAFAGGLLAAALVLGLAGGAAASTTKLVLAGTATALALQAGTSTLLILFAEETTSLFSWGSGTLNQLDGSAALRAPRSSPSSSPRPSCSPAASICSASATTRRGARRSDPLDAGHRRHPRRPPHRHRSDAGRADRLRRPRRAGDHPPARAVRPGARQACRDDPRDRTHRGDHRRPRRRRVPRDRRSHGRDHPAVRGDDDHPRRDHPRPPRPPDAHHGSGTADLGGAEHGARWPSRRARHHCPHRRPPRRHRPRPAHRGAVLPPRRRRSVVRAIRRPR